MAIDLPLAALGTEVRVLASGVGDRNGPAAAGVPVRGASVAPPSPVGLRSTASIDGGAMLRWTRRSRSGWRWRDGGDVPLVEEAERYRVRAGARETIVSAPEWTLTPAERAAGPVAVAVTQLGTLAESEPATLIVPITGPGV